MNLPVSSPLHQPEDGRPRKVASWQIATLVLIAALAIGLRLIGLSKGIWLDEYITISLVENEQMLSAIQSGVHPPLYYLLLDIWAQFSMEESYLRLFSVLFGLGTVSITMLWMWSSSRLAALTIGILTATHPILLRYSQELRGYPLLLLLTAASFWLTELLVRNPSRRRYYLGLMTTLSLIIGTHVIGAMITTTVFAWLLLEAIRLKRWRRLELPWLVGTFAVPTLIFIGLFFGFFGGNNWEGWIPAVSIDLSIGFAKTLLGVAALEWASESAFFMALIILSVVGMLVALLFGNWRRNWTLLAAAFFFVSQILAYSLLVRPIFWYRPLLPLLIPLFGFIARQLASTNPRPLRAVGLLSVLVLAGTYASYWIIVEAGTPVEPWRAMTEAIADDYQPGDKIVFFPAYSQGPALYYLPEVPEENSVKIGLAIGAPEAQARIEQMPESGGQERLYLITRLDASVAHEGQQTLSGLLRSLADDRGSPQVIFQEGLLIARRYDLITR